MTSAWIRPSVRRTRAYESRRLPDARDLLLDLNEGAPLAPNEWLAEIAAKTGMDAARRYPDASPLEERLARHLQVDQGNVIVTNGGDDAIDRICRACLEPGDELIFPTPSFEIISRAAANIGAKVTTVPWMGDSFPLEAVVSKATGRTKLVSVVSPNNPTGSVIMRSELETLAGRLPDTLIMVDLAYTEFATEDLTGAALDIPNAVIIRTFSKAYGLAGLRIGYAAGPADTIEAMRTVGMPFSCSTLSMNAALAALDMSGSVLAERTRRVREERAKITVLLRNRGSEVLDSQANFVLARFENAGEVWKQLADRGIRVRRFTNPLLNDWLRIGCPGETTGLSRLIPALEDILNVRE